jgi:putative intracellular protease/amidase
MQIVIPIYDRFTALDAVGPYEVLSRVPGATVTFAGVEQREYTTDTGMLTLRADAALADIPSPEVMVVPGGPGSTDAARDEALLDWVRKAHETTEWTTSVCTGSEVLGAAGILDGLAATTYWADREMLEQYGATATHERVVEQGKIVTAAGVSSGIDMALTLVARMTHVEVAKAVQLGIEYDPEPPFDSGSTKTASQETIDLVRATIAARDEAAA